MANTSMPGSPSTIQLRERQADAAALGEAGHHAAGDVEVAQARHRPDQGIAVGGEGERAVDHPLDPGAPERREVLEGDLEARRDPIEVGLEQLVAEVGGRGVLGPGPAVLLVGAEQQALALLAQVDLGVEIDAVRELVVAREDLRQVLGHQVVMRHGEHRQLEPDQAADLARPEPGGVDHRLGL